MPTWFAGIVLMLAVGVLIASGAQDAARDGSPYGDELLWLGLLAIVVPAAIRIVAVSTSREERLVLAVLMGMALYLVKVMHSPTGFTFHDEFGHLRATQDLLLTNGLYSPNPVVAAYANYPGLDIIVGAVSDVTGLSILASAFVVIGLARALLLFSLFVLFETVSRSSRVAGIACVVYMSNPSFYFFDAQFGYESLALSLGVSVMALTALAERNEGRHRMALTAAAALMFAALAVTHHLTSYMVALFLAGWVLVSLLPSVSRRAGRPARGPIALTIFACAAIAFWLVVKGAQTAGYLGEAFGPAFGDLARLLQDDGGAKQPFATNGIVETPAWERFIGIGSVAVLLLLLPFGLRRVLATGKANAPALMLAALAAAYPLTLALRLTQEGTEASQRASEFVFIGLGFAVGALVVHGLGRHPATGRRRAKLLTAAGLVAALLFAGGIVVGTAPYARLPGPYLVSADPRSVEPKGIAAAEWAQAYLGRGNGVIADRVNLQLMAGVGGQDPQPQYERGGLYTPDFYSAPRLGYDQLALLRRNGIRYVVVDRRLTTQLPAQGFYFGPSEPNRGRYTAPFPAALMEKFDRTPWLDRVFDEGDIRIYRVASFGEFG